MAQIRNLFDSTRALNRPIEKVITYQNRTEAQVRAEVSEYVVTEHIEECFSDLLKKMQAAHQGGGGTRSASGCPGSTAPARVPSPSTWASRSTAA